MADDRIERETWIAAAPERVWPLVAEPGFWATDDESIHGAVAVEGQSLVARHSEHGDFPIRVEKVDPPNYLDSHTAGWEQCFAALTARTE